MSALATALADAQALVSLEFAGCRLLFRDTRRAPQGQSDRLGSTAVTGPAEPPELRLEGDVGGLYSCPDGNRAGRPGSCSRTSAATIRQTLRKRGRPRPSMFGPPAPRTGRGRREGIHPPQRADGLVNEVDVVEQSDLAVGGFRCPPRPDVREDCSGPKPTARPRSGSFDMPRATASASGTVRRYCSSADPPARPAPLRVLAAWRRSPFAIWLAGSIPSGTRPSAVGSLDWPNISSTARSPIFSPTWPTTSLIASVML